MKTPHPRPEYSRTRRLGAASVEYLVMIAVFAGVTGAALGLGHALVHNVQRADIVLRSNSP